MTFELVWVMRDLPGGWSINREEKGLEGLDLSREIVEGVLCVSSLRPGLAVTTTWTEEKEHS